MSVSVTHAVMVDCVLMVSTNTLASVYRDLLEIAVRLVRLSKVIKDLSFFASLFDSTVNLEEKQIYVTHPFFVPFSILYFFLS